MANPAPGDFASIMERVNQTSAGSVVHPFGGRRTSVGPAGPANGTRLRQETLMFNCPSQLAEYDECMNRAWAGETSVRFEERFLTKEGDLVIVVCCYVADNPARARPGAVETEGDCEPPVEPHRLP